MKIRLASLRPGANNWTETAPPAEFDLNPNIYASPVEVAFSVFKRTNRLEIKLTCQTIGNFQCDRCSIDFTKTIKGEITVNYIQREEPFPDEMPGDDLRSYTVGLESIDITTEVRDALMLSVPFKILCREDCKGICSRCGADLNTESCSCEK